jgi:hypothetical protein
MSTTNNVSMNSVKVGTAGMTAGQIALSTCTTTDQVFALMAAGKCTMPEAQAMIGSITALAVATAAAKSGGALSLKVSDKGCVCLSGLNGKWPVSLYATQWERLLGHREQIEAFIAANRRQIDSLSAISRASKAEAKGNPAPEAPAAQ